ncbi:MAG: zinc-binding dehydrogenase [Phycisphaerae bacterium]
MGNKRKVVALMGNGHLGLVEQDIPVLKPGAVLVEVKASLVSPGTELGGWRQLKEEARNPKKDFKPQPFGYSNAGVVLKVGEGVKDLKVGQRVACVGAGYAQHTDVAAVPHNLCTPLPDKVTFAQGAYAMLAATGLQALRRSEPQIGEFFSVVGMGLVGQLTAQFLQASGAYVIGWDTIGQRLDIAKKLGITAVAQVGKDDEITLTKDFTCGMGLDGAIFAFGGDGKRAYEQTFQCMKKSPDGHRMGRVVVVGGARLEIPWSPANLDIRIAARTGPGYHDDPWEYGPDYPPVFMRWTTKTNLALCMRLIAEGRLNVDALTTHTIPLKDVDAGISAIINEPDAILGVVFTM